MAPQRLRSKPVVLPHFEGWEHFTETRAAWSALTTTEAASPSPTRTAGVRSSRVASTPTADRRSLSKLSATSQTERRSVQVALVNLRHDESQPPSHARSQRVLGCRRTQRALLELARADPTDAASWREIGEHVLRACRQQERLLEAFLIQRLFQPFRRLNSNSRSSSDGVGLGLAIVQAIADAHDATVSARARSGGGLGIDVAFPALD